MFIFKIFTFFQELVKFGEPMIRAPIYNGFRGLNSWKFQSTLSRLSIQWKFKIQVFKYFIKNLIQTWAWKVSFYASLAVQYIHFLRILMRHLNKILEIFYLLKQILELNRFFRRLISTNCWHLLFRVNMMVTVLCCYATTTSFSSLKFVEILYFISFSV